MGHRQSTVMNRGLHLATGPMAAVYTIGNASKIKELLLAAMTTLYAKGELAPKVNNIHRFPYLTWPGYGAMKSLEGAGDRPFYCQPYS